MEIETNFIERRLLKKIQQLSHSEKNDVFLELLALSADDYYLKKLNNHHLIYFTNSDDYGEHAKSVRLTDEGLHFFDWRLEKHIQFIKRSIITPFFVSLATTATIWLFGWLLGLVH